MTSNPWMVGLEFAVLAEMRRRGYPLAHSTEAARAVLEMPSTTTAIAILARLDHNYPDLNTKEHTS